MSDHTKRQTAAHARMIANGRQFGKSNLYEIFAREYLCDMTVTSWLSRQNITEYDILTYPNAKTAADIKNSPLYKALL